MTVTPGKARGVIDADTGGLLAVTGQGISWLRADHSRVDVTPDFPWGPVAAGGGAVAVAGPDGLQWHGPDGEFRTLPAPSEASYRLAVAGSAIAAVGRRGQLTWWRTPASDPHTATVDMEPDGLILDPTGSRMAIWGWDGGGDSVMTVLTRDTSSLTPVVPAEPWPTSDGGVALLSGGVIAVGGSGSVILLSATGDRLGSTELPGLERLTGRASGVAWTRSLGDDLVVAGVGVFPGPNGEIGLTVLAEAPMPTTNQSTTDRSTTDPFPQFAAVAGGELLLVTGVGPHELAASRLTGAGWTEPMTIRLPSRG